MKHCFLFVVVVFLLFLGASCLKPHVNAAVTPHPSGDTRGAVPRLDALTLATLRGAERVETFRVGVAPGFGQPAPTEEIDGHALSAKGLSRDRGFAAQAAAVLLDPRLNDLPRDRCLFRPGIVFRFWKGPVSVDCVMCFHCDDLLMLTRDAAGHVVHTGFSHFAPVRPALLALVKQTFPDDQEIQGLPVN